VNTNLSDFASINPCGLDAKVMTSLQAQTGKSVELSAFGARLIEHYAAVFETEFVPVDLESLARRWKARPAEVKFDSYLR